MSSLGQHFSPMAGNPVVDDLIKGQTMANELKALLGNALSVEDRGDNGLPIEALLEGISGSFSRALALLQAIGSYPFDPAMPCSNEQPSPNYKRKMIHRARQGGYRRSHLSQGTKVLRKNKDDGYSWRKYGQKDILSAKFPRSYFRCTHKYDRACRAVRHVQRSEEDPSLFEITYMGEHTCNHQVKSGEGSSSYVVNLFDTHTAVVDQKVPPSPSPPSIIKHECDEEAMSDPSRGCLSELHPVPDKAHFDGSVTSDMDDIFSMLSCFDESYNAGSNGDAFVLACGAHSFESFEQYKPF